MATQAEIRAEIKKIESILATGASSVNVDGVQVSFNHKEMRARLKELETKLQGKSRRGGAYGVTGLGN